MQFILDTQAKHQVTIQTILETQAKHENRITTLLDVCMSLATNLERLGEETDRRIRELTDAQSGTDEKPNALIDTVDKLIKRNRFTPPFWVAGHGSTSLTVRLTLTVPSEVEGSESRREPAAISATETEELRIAA